MCFQLNKLALLTGIDVPIPDLQLTIHQPCIKEISYIGELNYFSTIQTLCFNKDTIIASNPKAKNSLLAMSNFQIFMTLINMPGAKDKDRINIQNNLLSVFTILFPGYNVQIMPNGMGIYFNNAETKHSVMINDTNFDILKTALDEVTGVSNRIGGENSNFNPIGEKAAKIAAKLMKGRARAAADKGQSIEGVLGRYVSILTVGLSSMSLDDCLNLTVYQLYDLIERYGLYIGWDLDIRSRLAGGKPDDKPDDWMKDLH